MTRGRRLALVAAWLVVAVGVAAAGVAMQRKGVSELPVYTTGGARMAAGAEMYRPTENKPFTYPPFFAVPFIPFTALPESTHRTVWYGVNVVALAIVVFLLHRAVVARFGAGAGNPRRWLLWCLAGVLVERHLGAVFENQSHDLLVLLPLVLALVCLQRRDEVRGGLWIGVAAACKATPLLFAPVLLAQRRFRAVVALGLAAGLATLLPDVCWPRGDGRLWCVAWFDTFISGLRPGRPADTAGVWGAANVLNQNLAATLLRLSTPVAAPEGIDVLDVALWDPGARVVRGITLCAQGSVVAWILVVTRRGLQRTVAAPQVAFRQLGEVGAVLCGMVLLSPMSSKSHFCVLIVPIVYCLGELLHNRTSVTAWVLLAVSFVLGPMTAKYFLGREFGDELLARGSVTWCATATLIATGVLLLRRVAAPVRDP